MELIYKIFICFLAIMTFSESNGSSRTAREMGRRNNPHHMGTMTELIVNVPCRTTREMADPTNPIALNSQSVSLLDRLVNPPAEPLQPGRPAVQPDRMNAASRNVTTTWDLSEFYEEKLRVLSSEDVPLPSRHSFEHLCPDQKKHDLTLLTLYSFGLYNEPQHYSAWDFQTFLGFLELENQNFPYLYKNELLLYFNSGLQQEIQKNRPPISAGNVRPRETRTLKQLYEDHDFFQYFDESFKITFAQYACEQSLEEAYKWNKLFDKIKQRLKGLNRIENVSIIMRKFGIPEAAPGVDREFINILLPRFRIIVEDQALRLKSLLQPTEEFICDYLVQGLEYNFRSFSLEEIRKLYRVHKGIESFEEITQNPANPASNPLFTRMGFVLEIQGAHNRFTFSKKLPLKEKILLAYYGDNLKNYLDQRLEINEQRPEEHRGKDALGILSHYYHSDSTRSWTLNIPRNAIWDNFDSYCGRHPAPTRNFAINYIVQNFEYADPQNANQIRKFNEQEAVYLLDEIMFMNLS